MSEHEQTPHHEHAETTGERLSDTGPRIWIGSLADYNAGHLHGDWVNAAVPDDELEAAAQRIVEGSETPDAEEWAIFDHDGFGDFRVHEYELLHVVARVARGIQEHGLAFAAWAQHQDGDLDHLDHFTEAFLGEHHSVAAWVEDVSRDLGIEETIEAALPEQTAGYVSVDYEAMARDARLGGDIVVVPTPSGRVWIFDAR